MFDRYLIQGGAGGATASNLNLSPQQLVSCVNNANGYWSAGCNGGYSDEVRLVSAVMLRLFALNLAPISPFACQTTLNHPSLTGHQLCRTFQPDNGRPLPLHRCWRHHRVLQLIHPRVNRLRAGGATPRIGQRHLAEKF